MGKGSTNVRYAEVDREVPGARVHVVLDLDSGHRCDANTGVPFFDELLAHLARYAGIGLGVSLEPDGPVGHHRVIETVGLCFGLAIQRALEDSEAVVGTGDAQIPAGDALVSCALDLDGRPFLGWHVELQQTLVAGLESENVRQFFESCALFAGASLHLRREAGYSDQHVCEALFKAFGKTLREATRRADPGHGVPLKGRG